MLKVDEVCLVIFFYNLSLNILVYGNLSVFFVVYFAMYKPHTYIFSNLNCRTRACIKMFVDYSIKISCGEISQKEIYLLLFKL